jgi:hypothetical protein
MPRAMQAWTPADVLHLRWYAERGFSQAETAKVMDRSYGSIINKATQLGIRFNGPDGAPFLNHNARHGRWLKELKRIAADGGANG